MKLFFNGFDYVIAEDESDARERLLEYEKSIGEDYEKESVSRLTFQEFDKEHVIWHDLDKGLDSQPVTPKELIEIYGKGYIGSTEF